MNEDGGQESECAGCKRLSAELEQLKEQVEKLQKALAESQRAGKRQAAPFRKPKVAVPRKPGRKSGEEYGTQARRTVPEQIDEWWDALLPECCPQCGCGELTEDAVCQQYQTDIPRKPIHRQFDIHVGHCTGCGERVQGRHELQTSDALGAAVSQLGPDLQAALTVANKELGLSHGKCRRLVAQLFGITISRGTNWRAQQRLAKKLQPSYELIGEQVRGSPRVVCDETGWRVNGEGAWLHDFFMVRAVLPFETCLFLIVDCCASFGGEADVGGRGDFDELNAASKDSHRGEDDNAGFDDFSVADKFQSHADQVESEEDQQPAGDFTSFEHGAAFRIVLRGRVERHQCDVNRIREYGLWYVFETNFRISCEDFQPQRTTEVTELF